MSQESAQIPAQAVVLTDEMVAAFWDSKTKTYREKWTTRMRSGLSDKRKVQLQSHMTEFFARQKGPMKEIAKAKRAEFQRQLEDAIKAVQQCQQNLGHAQIQVEQLRGAVAGIDKLLAASEPTKDGKPKLELVPPLPVEEPTSPPESA